MDKIVSPIGYARIAEQNPVPLLFPVSPVHVAEEVQLGFHRFYLFQKRCTAVTYSVADTVKDAEWRTVRYQHVNPVGDLCVMLDFRKVAILHAHKHRSSVETYSVDEKGFVAEIMHVVRQTVKRGVEQAAVVVAGDENLVRVGQFAQPLYKVDGLALIARHGEIAAVHKQVGIRQIGQLAVPAVGVGEVEDLHEIY